MSARPFAGLAAPMILGAAVLAAGGASPAADATHGTLLLSVSQPEGYDVDFTLQNLATKRTYQVSSAKDAPRWATFTDADLDLPKTGPEGGSYGQAGNLGTVLTLSLPKGDYDLQSIRVHDDRYFRPGFGGGRTFLQEFDKKFEKLGFWVHIEPGRETYIGNYRTVLLREKRSGQGVQLLVSDRLERDREVARRRLPAAPFDDETPEADSLGRFEIASHPSWPLRASGLWSFHLVYDGGAYAIPDSQICLDKAAEMRLTLAGAQMDQRKCERYLLNATTPGKYEVHSVCSLANHARAETTGTVSGDLASGYTVDATAVTSGASNAQQNGTHHLSVTAQRIGDCPNGQLGGDMTTNGKTANVFRE